MDAPRSAHSPRQAAREARLARRARRESLRQRRRRLSVVTATVVAAAVAVVGLPLAVAEPGDDSPVASETSQTAPPQETTSSSDAGQLVSNPTSAPTQVASMVVARATTPSQPLAEEDGTTAFAGVNESTANTPVQTAASDDVAPADEAPLGTATATGGSADAEDLVSQTAEQALSATSGRELAADLPVLSEGDSGAVVRAAQRALGIDPVSGYFGPLTKEAVMTFQAGVGLPETGMIATFTWTALGAEALEKATRANARPNGYKPGEPPAPAAPPILQQTDAGEAVAVLQRALNVTPVTGTFGPVTAQAVRSFQADAGLPTTGTVAGWTWSALGETTSSAAATAHARFGTTFGPGAPAPSSGASSSGGSSSSGSSSSSSGSSSSGSSSGSGSSGGSSGSGSSSGSSGSGSSGNSGSSSGSVSVAGRFCPAPSFTYGDGMGAPRGGGRLHAGLDLMGKRGTPIYAIDGGTVTRAGYQANGSLVLDITGPNGMFFYGHFDSVTVGRGASVKAGQLIGYMGDTGSPGAVHLHLELRPRGWSGGAVDPVPLIRKLCG